MFIDARTTTRNTNINYDICVIGAGAAGITLARNFNNKLPTICLLESGGLEPDLVTQQLYQGDSIGIPYFDPTLMGSRLRYFGGTTNHWSGYCRLQRKSDFEERDWIPNSGWPIDQEDLNPYYERTIEEFGFTRQEWNIETWEKAIGEPRISFKGNNLHTGAVLIRPVRMGQVWRDDLEKSGNVHVYLGANLTDIETDELAKVVRNVHVTTLTGNQFTISAKYFVLAAGGIENPRILLLANNVQHEGLGNHYDLVGRYFMEHPRFLTGIIKPTTPHIPLGLYSRHKIHENKVSISISLSEEASQKERIVATEVKLTAVPDKSYIKSNQSEGVASLHRVLSEIRNKELPDNLGQDIGNIIADLDDVSKIGYNEIVYHQAPIDHIECRTRIDSAPIPESRVVLGSEMDELGQRRAQLDWQLSELDKKSVRRTMEILAAEIARAGIGRLKTLVSDDDSSWPDDLEGGWHHMGTTRMANDPRKGVVDRNCKVHGISNLYIAGSSIFPTAGSGTPTLTIVALTHRLSDHLKKII